MTVKDKKWAIVAVRGMWEGSLVLGVMEIRLRRFECLQIWDL